MTCKQNKKKVSPKTLLLELKKMLYKERDVALICCDKDIKARRWYDAFKNNEHADSIQFVINEIEHYEEKGEWL